MSVTFYTQSGETITQFANANFESLNKLLGTPYADPPYDYSGYICGASLADFIRKIDFVLNSIAAMPELDGGTETVELREENGTLHIFCPLPPGYWTEKLSVLRQSALIAKHRNQKIYWA